ncbi:MULTISPECIES: ribosome recycling factor [Oceanithermus]|uniref:Ribosome-recycling factor n=1 Tax=Oceanithermus profundus (strain DSM 14977 / NBRC 100410 / VKM B-2274 / 506) TaxID=670487 RepID=E4U7V1_OCEP5|nr:ribosome recycling factor [Oceanithermus profundus]ADR36550.1 ribosome recycling factor [Oceanithermus profundus DSM 14977]
MFKPLFKETREHMQKTLEVFESNLATLRTGRANPALLEHIKVDYYGSMMPLNQLASISAPDARTLVVQAWDQNALPLIEKAIRDSDLGLNPNNQGDTLFINIPALTAERRKEIVKAAHNYAEEARVAVRNIRRDALHRIKKMSEEEHLPEDDVKRAEKEVQELTDEFIEKINAELEAKEKEILSE